MTYSYSVDSLIAAHTALANLIDSGSGPGTIQVRTGTQPANANATATGTLLGTITLADPCGTVSGTTGQLTFSAATPDSAADDAGTIGYVRVLASDGTKIMDLPVQEGSTPVSGYAVFNTLTVAAGVPIELLSMTVG